MIIFFFFVCSESKVLFYFKCAGFNQQTSSLWTSVSGLNYSLVHHDGIFGSVQKNQEDVYSRIKNLNSSLNNVLKELKSLYDQNINGELGFLLLPCMYIDA